MHCDQEHTGHGRLVNVLGERCCLGVACEVKGLSIDFGSYIYDGNHYSVSLPDSIKWELGIIPEIHDNLITMNDVEGKTFLEIADWLEKKYP
jgi:hypothetical protein